MRELLVGDHLDQYEITELLARSGMAEVFRARDTESGQDVALKVPHLHVEGDVVFHQRFQREEALGQRLAHPSIIRFLPARDKSRMYIAMELVEGRSLRAELRAHAPLPVERALDLGRKIGEALVYLHAHRVVHRDLKPENVLVLPDDHIKLIDLGIALDESARRLTWFGLSTPIGTPDYMAPEQISGRRGDARTDVYALGTMLYEMLTGHLPYASTNAVGLLRGKARERPDAPTRYVPGLDPRLEDIVLHAIEPSPHDRYASAAELLADLTDPSRVVPGARAVSPAARGLAALGLPKGVLGGLSLILVLSALVWLTLLSHQSGGRTPPVPTGDGSAAPRSSSGRGSAR